jgi:hypothetical protein
MNNPVFKVRLVRLLILGSIAVAVRARAESPDPGAPRSRTRPQIIYHLPPNYAAMLHSQAKTQNNEFSRENSVPNAAQQEPAPPASFQEPRVKPKLNESRPKVIQPRSSGKAQGHGNPHGNKSRKK